MAAPSIDELQGLIGTTFGPSHRVTIDQARINAFADATLDHQWIHVDPERAATGPFGTTVAHGYLTLSLLVDMVASMDFFPAGLSLIVNYGIDRLRFPAPVPAGSTVQATAILSKLHPHVPRRGGRREHPRPGGGRPVPPGGLSLPTTWLSGGLSS